MVGGYALASALFLGNGWGAAISDIPNNLAQNFCWDGFRLCGLLCISKERKLIHGSGATEEGYEKKSW